MKVSFSGYGEQAVTFEAAEGVKAGAPVKITANGTVGVCAKNDVPCGVALSVRNGMAAVQLKGYVRLPYSGTGGISVGWNTISAGDNSTIQTGESGKTVLVTDVDSTASTCGMIL